MKNVNGDEKGKMRFNYFDRFKSKEFRGWRRKLDRPRVAWAGTIANFISLTLLVIACASEHWFAGYEGHVGLWKQCYYGMLWHLVFVHIFVARPA